MKKIGILTFWGVPNYGCFFQAYALQKYLEQNFKECKVEQIAYLEKSHYRQYYKMNIQGYKMFLINPHWYKKILAEFRLIGKKRKLRAFLDYYEMIPHSSALNSINNIGLEYDLIVLGSDIIWDASNEYVINEQQLFGVGLDTVKISYAPSCGNACLKNYNKDILLNGLKTMDNISVRDQRSKEIIEEIVDKKVEIVLDPTLLYDFKSDSNVSDRYIKEKYIVVYGNDFLQQYIQDLRQYASDNKMQIVNLEFNSKAYDWCDINLKRDDISPFVWASIFKYSEVVFTSTYHGLLFGLIFEKKIVFSPSEFIFNKSNKLVSDLELVDILYNGMDFKDILEYDWNYLKINQTIDLMRQKSHDYLRESLSLLQTESKECTKK